MPPMPLLINTPLQRGDSQRQGALNRFSGFPSRARFCRIRETAEAVGFRTEPARTSLKRGANERCSGRSIRMPLLSVSPICA